jgi:hypothetical protein
MSQYPGGLATIEIENPDGPQLWVLPDVHVVRDMGLAAPVVLVSTIRGGEKGIELSTLDTSTPGYWEGHSWPNEYAVTVRPTTEEDAIATPTLSSTMPLPLGVIAFQLSREEALSPKLYALLDEENFVITMMLDSEAGLYLRHRGMWHPLVEDAVDGLTIQEVEETALDAYDQADEAGQLIPFGVMQTPSLVLQPAAVEPVQASALIIEVPKLTTQDDLEEAIAVATDRPEVQWWVERRAKALGLAAEFPWSDS